jgi:hypothetical protein
MRGIGAKASTSARARGPAMATLNYGNKELICKIVYYGPGYGGKTTNLLQIHRVLPKKSRGEMTSLATSEDRTLFFDLLPVDMGRVGDYFVKVQLYTVPGQVRYNATRRLVLNGVDGVVMVFDSDPARENANYISLANLEENLQAYGLSPDQVPIVFQYNKRDLPGAMGLDKMRATLNPDGRRVEFESAAIEGIGVNETVSKICSLVFERLEREFSSEHSATSGFRHSMRRIGRAQIKARKRRRPVGPPPPPEAPERPEAAPPVAPMRLRQLSEARVSGVTIGHALIDMKPLDSAAPGEEFSTAVDVHPILGRRRVRSGVFYKSPRQDDPSGRATVYVARSTGAESRSDIIGSHLLRIRGESGPDRLYLDWETPWGRLRLLPEGERTPPARPPRGRE